MAIAIDKVELPRIAIIGCGAAAERFYIPHLIAHPQFASRVTLIDRSEARLGAMAEAYGFTSLSTDLDAALDDLDAAIITTPHRSHAPLAIQCMSAGLNVLVEKPIACSRRDADEVAALAAANGRTVMVNNTRRMFPSYRRVHEMIRQGELGRIEQMSIFDGGPLEWQSVTGLALGPDGEKHGVLMDRGAHSVDILCWWLGGEPEIVSAQSDAWGGSDSVFELHIESDGVPAALKLSRLFKLANRFEVRGTQATVSGDLFDWSNLELTPNGGKPQRVRAGEKGLMFEGFVGELLVNFINACNGSEAPRFTGADVLPSIRVIEEAYDRASRFELEWYSAVNA